MKTRKELKNCNNTLEFQKEYQYDGKDLGSFVYAGGNYIPPVEPFGRRSGVAIV